MRNYHRLDIGCSFSKEKKHGTRVWSVNVYNVYNRINAVYYYFGNVYTYNQSGYPVSKETKLKQMSYFPFMPSFTYSFKF